MAQESRKRCKIHLKSSSSPRKAALKEGRQQDCWGTAYSPPLNWLVKKHPLFLFACSGRPANASKLSAKMNVASAGPVESDPIFYMISLGIGSNCPMLPVECLRAPTLKRIHPFHLWQHLISILIYAYLRISYHIHRGSVSRAFAQIAELQLHSDFLADGFFWGVMFSLGHYNVKSNQCIPPISSLKVVPPC